MTCSSETSVDFQWNTQHYVREDRPCHNDHRKNLKSCFISIVGLLYLSILLHVCSLYAHFIQSSMQPFT
jgi:hypothetical protein